MNQEIIIKDSPLHQRLLTLDAVRGLAVIGMLIQHFALQPWNNFVSGNTMILFMLCSGISYILMVQDMKNRGNEPSTIRARVLARAIFINFIGYAIMMLNGQLGVVLPAYAMMFLLALALLLEEKVSLLFFPFARVGKVALTLYCTHFIIAWVLMLYGMNPSSLAQFAGGDIVILFVTLIAGWFLTLHGNEPLETAIRWFERQFYQEERGKDETIIKS